MATSNQQAKIPTIDISSSNKNSASQLLDAASKYGFVFIENDENGIPPQDIAHMFDLSKMFFASPVEVKQEVSIRYVNQLQACSETQEVKTTSIPHVSGS